MLEILNLYKDLSGLPGYRRAAYIRDFEKKIADNLEQSDLFEIRTTDGFAANLAFALARSDWSPELIKILAGVLLSYDIDTLKEILHKPCNPLIFAKTSCPFASKPINSLDGIIYITLGDRGKHKFRYCSNIDNLLAHSLSDICPITQEPIEYIIPLAHISDKYLHRLAKLFARDGSIDLTTSPELAQIIFKYYRYKSFSSIREGIVAGNLNLSAYPSLFFLLCSNSYGRVLLSHIFEGNPQVSIDTRIAILDKRLPSYAANSAVLALNLLCYESQSVLILHQLFINNPSLGRTITLGWLQRKITDGKGFSVSPLSWLSTSIEGINFLNYLFTGNPQLLADLGIAELTKNLSDIQFNKGTSILYLLCKNPAGIKFLQFILFADRMRLLQQLTVKNLIAELTDSEEDSYSPLTHLCMQPDGALLLIEILRLYPELIISLPANELSKIIWGSGTFAGASRFYLLCRTSEGLNFLMQCLQLQKSGIFSKFTIETLTNVVSPYIPPPPTGESPLSVLCAASKGVKFLVSFLKRLPSLLQRIEVKDLMINRDDLPYYGKSIFRHLIDISAYTLLLQMLTAEDNRLLKTITINHANRNEITEILRLLWINIKNKKDLPISLMLIKLLDTNCNLRRIIRQIYQDVYRVISTSAARSAGHEDDVPHDGPRVILAAGDPLRARAQGVQQQLKPCPGTQPNTPAKTVCGGQDDLPKKPFTTIYPNITPPRGAAAKCAANLPDSLSLTSYLAAAPRGSLFGNVARSGSCAENLAPEPAITHARILAAPA